jgi:hypothetical protein
VAAPVLRLTVSVPSSRQPLRAKAMSAVFAAVPMVTVTSSKPMTVPAALTSVSCSAPVVLVKLTKFRSTEVTVSVCAALCAPAAAGANSAPWRRGRPPRQRR